MSTLLAIDTSVPRCAVALATGGQLLERCNDQDRHAAQEVLAMIDELLTEADATLTDVDAIAVVSGPGSFTGLRIGIGAVQGLSMATATPVVPVSALALLAMTGFRRHGGERWLACDNAHNEEVYLGAYATDAKRGAELLGREQLAGVSCLRRHDLADATDPDVDATWSGIGSGWQHRQALENTLNLRLGRCIPESFRTMEDLCALAAIRFARGETVSAEKVLPNYVREQMNWS